MLDPNRTTDPNEVRQRTSMLPDIGWLRLKDIIGDDADANSRPIIPIGKTAWFSGVKRGWYPPPHRFGRGVVFWSASDIRRLIETGDWREPEAQDNNAQGAAA